MELFPVQQVCALNELEMLVYQYTVEHPNTVPYMRIRELAAEAHVSTTTILHFCKKMGCEGYAEFKARLKEQVGTPRADSIPDALSELQVFFEQAAAPEYQDRLDEAAALIAKAERVFMVGIGNSGCIADYGARYFSNMGKFTLSVTDPFYPITITPNTTITAVILSVSGETPQSLSLARQFKEKGASVVAVTCAEHSSLAGMADFALPYFTTMRRNTASERRTGDPNFDFTSQIPAVYLLEALSRRVYNRLQE